VAFPLADTEARLNAVANDEAVLRPGVLALCDHLGLDANVERFPNGSLPVYAVGGEHVLKLFPQVHVAEMPVERDVLAAVDGRLPIPTPGVLESGVVDGWGYVLMRRLHGECLTAVWPRLNREQRGRVATRVGEGIKVLHGVPSPELGPGDWQAFIARQKAGCVERQRVRGLHRDWLDQIPGFLDSVDLGDPEPVLLHTEVMSDHLLVGPGLELSGLVDFEPAMRGAAEYEFVATGVFLARGDRQAHSALLRGYGYREVDRELPRRLLAYALLHVYSNLPWYLREIPPGAARTLDSLADLWFGAPEV
jgi:hygromycin-B 7''-O-kinase